MNMGNNMTRELRKAEWATHNGLTEYRGKKEWLQFLTGKRPKLFETPYFQAGFDHISLWLKDGKPYCVLSQPYGFNFEAIKEAMVIAERYGLEFDVNRWPSYHHDGVISILWSKA